MSQSTLKCIGCERMYLLPVGYAERAIQCPFCAAWMDHTTGDPAAPLAISSFVYKPPAYITAPDRFKWGVRAALASIVLLAVGAIVVAVATSKPDRQPTLAADVAQWTLYESPDGRFQARFPAAPKTGARLLPDDTVVQFVSGKTEVLECEVAWFDLRIGEEVDLLRVQMHVRKQIGQPTSKAVQNNFHGLPGRYLEFEKDGPRVQIIQAVDRVWLLTVKRTGYKGAVIAHGQFFANVKLTDRDFGITPLILTFDGGDTVMIDEDLQPRFKLIAWGGRKPYKWRAVKLPDGVEILPETGATTTDEPVMQRCRFRGRIQTLGRHDIIVEVTDADGREFSLQSEVEVVVAPDSIGELVAELTVDLVSNSRPQQTTHLTMPAGVALIGYLAVRDATGRYYPYVESCKYEGVPDWLNVAPESSDGYFSGVPSAPGVYTFSATAVMRSRSVPRAYTGSLEITIVVEP